MTEFEQYQKLFNSGLLSCSDCYYYHSCKECVIIDDVDGKGCHDFKIYKK